jgi:hypothetical protein
LFAPAAMLWLERYLTESSPRLQHVAELTASLAEPSDERRTYDAS